MVKVPEYTPNVSLRPAFQSQWTVRANAEHFGAAVGRGLQQAAQGMGQLAKSLQAVKALEDEARVREARNQYMQERDVLMYDPENGYMNTQGRNALDQRSAFVENMRKIREKYAKSLTPEQQRLFDRSIETLELDARRSAMIHNGNELKKYVIDGSKAAAENFANEALRNIDNPAMADKYLSAGLIEIREISEKTGMAPEILEQMEREYLSSYRSNVTSVLLEKDARAAQSYFNQYKDQFSADKAIELQSKIDTAVKDLNGRDEAARILGMGRAVDASSAPEGGAVSSGVSGRALRQSGPSRARAFLQSRSNKDASHVDGLDETFATNLAAMIQDAPPGISEKLGIYSGYRSSARQAQLYQEALRKYGSPQAARRWVAPPGRSNHNHGRAVDLSYNGQSLKHAPKEVQDWVRENAPKYGMHVPMGHEPWHIEPLGTRGTAPAGAVGTVVQNSVAVSPRATFPSFSQIEEELSKIKDPYEQEVARKHIYAQIDARNKIAEAQEKQAKAELWRYIDQGATPDEVPVDVRMAAGMAAVSSAWSYVEKAEGRNQIEDDEEFVYRMRLYAATNPEEFAKMDLMDYFDRMSKATRKEFAELQSKIISNPLEAKKDGINITSAMSQARTQLEAVGLTVTGKSATEREKAAKRIAQFENNLMVEMEAFRQKNGQPPNQLEIQELINKLLLPIIIRQEKSAWDITKTPWSAFNETDSFLFEVGQIGDLDGGGTAEFNIKYEDIPTGYRLQIERIIREEGGIPSEDEVVRRYILFLQDAYGIQEDGGTIPGQIAP